jgi:hypothetical protein
LKESDPLNFVLFTLFVLVIGSAQLFGQDKTYDNPELIGIYQFKNENSKRFDLSGIVEHGEKIFVVADKSWNTFLYQINFSGNQFFITETIPLNFDARGISSSRLDLEGVDFCSDTYFLINEATNDVFRVYGNEVFLFDIQYEPFGENPSEWLKNAGYEGIALDCSQGIVFLAKERQPRFIYKISMQSGTILDKFNIPESESNDFSDLKFENGFLFLLERNGNYVSKVDPETHEVIGKVSYRHICSDVGGKLFEPSKYGMAEALLIRTDEIWVGLDNNGLKVSDLAREKYGITGNDPVIIRFKRPNGF